ncbi:MAG: hypothetical protein C0490_21110, partial [Marivirga sp.]|nr:hypothetical protein [Marivirga sp.]
MKCSHVLSLFAAAVLLLQSCAIVRPGEVGVDVHFGKTKSEILEPGPYHFLAPFGRKIERFSTRITNYSLPLKFHTIEGIEVSSETTLLYHMVSGSARAVFTQFGKDYQKTVIEDNLVTVIRQTGLAYKATELITARATIEKTIKQKMDSLVGKYGFAIDLVMLKEVDLPLEVRQTIEAKLKAEEIAKKTKIDNEIKRYELDFQLERDKKEAELEIIKQRLVMDFSIEKQKKESERLLIE